MADTCASRRGLTLARYPAELSVHPSYDGRLYQRGFDRGMRLSPGELDHVVELAVLGAGEERGDLRARVDKGGSSGEAGIAHRDLAVRQVSYLNARAVGVAVLALLPSDIGEFRGRYAVVWLSHVLFLPVTEPGCVTGLENCRSRGVTGLTPWAQYRV